MVLPLYLAMTGEEMANAPALPRFPGRMADCQDLEALSEAFPAGAMLVLTDRRPRKDPDRIAAAMKRLKCESVLLDFERQPDTHSRTVANALFQALTCPLAAPPGFVEDSGCAVFLPPCPLHVPLAEYLRPWQGREIWLDVALQQQTVTVTSGGTQYGPPVPADRQTGGHYDELLRCQCLTEISEEEVRFLLFDTPETLIEKLTHAAALGVSRAVGLYQELQFFL